MSWMFKSFKGIHECSWIRSDKIRFFLLESQPVKNESNIEQDNMNAGTNSSLRTVLKNPILRIFIVLLFVFSSTSIFFGWPLILSMLQRDGVFIEGCKQQLSFNSETQRYISSEVCLEQHNKLKKIMGYYTAAEFTFGVVAGYCLDLLGPMITGFIGFLFSSTAFIMINQAYGSQLLFYMAAILLGGSCNLIVFGALVFADYFQYWENCITACLIAIQNGGTAVPILFYYLYNKIPKIQFRQIMWNYYVFYLLPLGILFIANLPLVRFSLNPLYNNSDAAAVKGNQPESNAQVVDLERDQTYDQQQEKLINVGATATIASKAEDSLGKLENDIAVKETDQTSLLNQTAFVANKSHKVHSYKIKSTTFFQDIITVEFLLFLVLIFVFTMQYTFYIINVQMFTEPHISDFIGYAMPLTSVLGIFFGVILHYTKSMPIAIFISALTALFYFLSLKTNSFLSYTTAILYIIGTSVVYSIKFTYIEETYSSVNQGKLLSIVSLISGVSSIITTDIEVISKQFHIYIQAVRDITQ